MLAENRWIPHLPSAEELRLMAIQIYHEENTHVVTNPEDYELKAPEGKYYLKARKRAMMGYVAIIEVALAGYKTELEQIIDMLKEIETPVWGLNIKALGEAIDKIEEALQ